MTSQRDLLGKCIVATGALTLLALSDVAFSQQANTPDQGTATLQEIVVTAEKRSESLQDVPIAVTAIQGDALVSAGVDSQKSLATLMPNVAVDVNANFVAPYIRGVGTTYANPGLEPSVATYDDDIYVSRADAGLMSFDDTERVEVLQGPQGTLYGRNTTGGAIRIISKEPTQSFSAGASITGGNYGELGASAYVSGPIVPGLLGRLSAQYDGDSGYISNLNPANPTLQNRDMRMFRGKLTWDAIDKLTVKLTGEYSVKMDHEGQAFQPLFPGTTEVGVALGGTASSNPSVYSGDYPNNDSAYQGFESEQGGGELRIDYDLDTATLSSISGVHYIWFHGLADLDTTSIPLIEANTIGEHSTDFSQEFQVVSNGKGDLNWVGGLYYFHESGSHNFGVGGLAISAPPSAGGTGVPNGFTGGAGYEKIDSFAPYGQVTYKFTPQWEGLVGARYTTETKTLVKNDFYITTVDSNFIPSPNWLVTIPASNDGAQVKPRAFTPKLGVNFRPMEGVMAYFSYSKGFKSGGFNLPQPSPQPVQQVGNEYLDAYELGLKLEIGQVRVNASVFHYEGKDLQVQVTDQSSGITSVKNAASSKTNGFSTDVAYAATRRVELDAGLGILDAKFDQFVNGQITTPAAVGTVTVPADLSGNTLPQAPRWTGYFRPTYHQPLPGTLGSVEGSVVVSYSAAFYWTADDQLREPAKTLINANLGWKADTAHYGLNLFGTNLTNKVYDTHEAPFSTGGWRVPAPPREYGVRAWVAL